MNVKNFQHINFDSGSDEYYTPLEIVNAARRSMGGTPPLPVEARCTRCQRFRVNGQWQELPATNLLRDVPYGLCSDCVDAVADKHGIFALMDAQAKPRGPVRPEKLTPRGRTQFLRAWYQYYFPTIP